MTPIDQTVFSDAAAGTKGNCFQAVIASMLHVELETVPHFLHDGCDTLTFRRRVNDYLRPLNLSFIDVPPFNLKNWNIRGLNHDAAGYSPRGIYHATCARDGEILHDPHPSRAGLNSIDTWGIFIVLDPSQPIGRAP